MKQSHYEIIPLDEDPRATLDRLLGPTSDSVAARAAINSVPQGGCLEIQAIGSFDVPVETPESIERIMQYFLADAVVRHSVDTSNM